MNELDERPICKIGGRPLSVVDVHGLANAMLEPAIDDDPAVRRRIDASVAFVERSLSEGKAIYGITTGYGASAEFGVDPEVAREMPLNLLRYHGCGVGDPLSEEESAAVVSVRLASLARGYSAVRLEVLERLVALLERRILPCIPSEGSVGASGDLTPLSYIAAVLAGEREVWVNGEKVAAADALAQAGLSPLTLAPKESLAIMNGTSVMAALGALSWMRAERLARLACLLSAMTSDVLEGRATHFEDRIFELKPHRGQRLAARWIRDGIPERDRPAPRIQDRYSIRCSPHIIGVLMDLLPFTREVLETEINGVNDNPIIDGEAGLVYHGGNFYGGHACLVTDSLKNAVANIADLLERQMVILNNPRTNHGLPANLVGTEGPSRLTHHGFKAMEITASALTAEALKLTMPASAFSRSTESHNQDKVSMGSISARECNRVLDLAETVAVIHLLALCQAVELRGKEPTYQDHPCHERSLEMCAAVREYAQGHSADRRMDTDIEAVLHAYRENRLPLGDYHLATGDALEEGASPKNGPAGSA